MSDITKQQLHDALRYVREQATLLRSGFHTTGAFDGRCGICWNVSEVLERNCAKAVCVLAKSWPLYSGEQEFPVPSPTGRDPSAAYYERTGMWEGPYGDLRMQLLDFLIAETDNT